MKRYDLFALVRQQALSGESYLEFLREETLSMGVYILPAGADDPQHPHEEDEVYYIVGGRAWLDVDGEEYPVVPGSIVFVPAGVPHHFYKIEADRTRVLRPGREPPRHGNGGRWALDGGQRLRLAAPFRRAPQRPRHGRRRVDPRAPTAGAPRFPGDRLRGAAVP